MKRITIQVSEATVASLCELAKRCNAANAYSGGFTSHGPLTVASLLALLAEDAGMVIARTGSWDGANMAQVFSPHGYEV